MLKASLLCLCFFLFFSFCACAGDSSAAGPSKEAASLSLFSSGGAFKPPPEEKSSLSGETDSSLAETGASSSGAKIEGVSPAGLGRIHFSDIPFVPEFSDWNLGTAFFASGKNEITVSVTQITGTSTGTPEGPGLVFRVDLTLETVAERVFSPEPDGAFFIRQHENAGELENLSDERLVEIAKDFLKIIQQL